ncbi:hypothetical protein B0H13DRAFT_1923357 [Mycena leptocephala]|nr:hypothetical protein B0H13DRAFT_1923357 [Mycena leptocephala]
MPSPEIPQTVVATDIEDIVPDLVPMDAENRNADRYAPAQFVEGPRFIQAKAIARPIAGKSPSPPHQLYSRHRRLAEGGALGKSRPCTLLRRGLHMGFAVQAAWRRVAQRCWQVSRRGSFQSLPTDAFHANANQTVNRFVGECSPFGFEKYKFDSRFSASAADDFLTDLSGVLKHFSKGGILLSAVFFFAFYVSGEISHFISVSRLPPPPPLSPLKSWPYDGTTQSQCIHVSTDGRRAFTDRVDVRPQKKARRDPEALEDTYATWTPVNDDGLTEAHTFADAVSSYDVVVDDDEGSKRKRYKNSDEPMSSWRPLQQEFLDALLRRSGLGNYLSETACSCCGAGPANGTRFFRCTQCGEFLQCGECVRSRHQLSPLHCLWEWNGEFWTEATLWGSTPNAAGLTGLGMVYQLGHHGLPCEFPGVRRSMVVMNGTGIHTIDFQYCGCDTSSQTNNLGQLLDNGWYPATTIDPSTCATIECLETFRLLNVIGNITVHDYVGTLERLMDPVHVSSVPDRYKAFGRMARQYAFLQRVKRAGRGHESDGLRKTQRGGLAVPCWACPHDGKNLPEGWRDVDPKYRYLYMLLLALDANFRLKNRLRANEHQDPSLGPGLGYFVDPGPYKEHLRHYVAEKDVSSCIAFAALLQKETRLTTGLRVSGVGGCVCARHGVVRPQGLGDLQKGERYVDSQKGNNSNFDLREALAGVALLCLTISYDIACQWRIHLLERAKKIEGKRRAVEIPTRAEDFCLPVWHAQAHEVLCQTDNSLSYALGVGRTDGEGIERTWAVLNPVGFATKEMGEGGRHDAIENKIDHMNFEKNVNQGKTLARKLIVAIAERDKQVAEFKDVDSTLERSLRGEWKTQIEEWIVDRSKPNPYCLPGGKSAGPSEAAVLRELKEVEAADAAEGRSPLSASTSTPSAFMKAGLQLEESHGRLTGGQASYQSRVKRCDPHHCGPLQPNPGVADGVLAEAADIRATSSRVYAGRGGTTTSGGGRTGSRPAPPKAEDIKLWLPSDLPAAVRRTACMRGIPEAEAKLRNAQCVDALDTLRSRLHTQKHLITWRDSGSVGQRAATRSATLIGRVGDRISRVAAKYRGARTALIALKGPAFAPQFKELKPGDMNVNAEEESDALSRKKLGRLGSTRRPRLEPSNARKTFSWIWTVGGGPGEDQEQLHECLWTVRVEWSKARARRDRWVEEVDILREEMKRVLRFLRWIQVEWRRRAELREDIDPQLAAGLKAYALRQVAVHRRIAAGFHVGWNVSVATAVRDVVRQDGTVYRELLESEELDMAPTTEGLELGE